MIGIEKRADEELEGGIGDHAENLDPRSVIRGAFVELEHSSEIDEAIEIAKDHLVEDPAYYENLEEMEHE